MSFLQVIILAVVQGLAELLPVSSSAHVVVAEKLMGLDPSSPQMTLLLVLLHTGTMLSVIVYFWKSWKATYFASKKAFARFAGRLIWATVLTGILGEGLRKVLEHTLLRGEHGSADIEQLFGRLDLIAPALAAAGVLILVAGLMELRKRRLLPLTVTSAALAESLRQSSVTVTMGQATVMGLVQGLALPFRGFSRSGSTISAGMLAGAQRSRTERFSFALAVALTPAVVGMEALRYVKASRAAASAGYAVAGGSLWLDLLGMVCAFIAGMAALRWLSSWLEHGRWHLFGIYCLAASAVVFYLHTRGF